MIAFDSGWLNCQPYAKVTLPRGIAMHQSRIFLSFEKSCAGGTNSVPFWSDDTHHTIGAAQLSAMRDDAVLINVARGGVVDEAALIEALRTATIRGATLDVTEIEPLPPDSPLWTLDNCVITPHDAGHSPLGEERLTRLFLDNLSRYTQGEPLLNEVAAPAPRAVSSVFSQSPT